MNIREKGFTLIELIIVLVILGILASYSAVRFMDFGPQARTAVVQSLVGSLQSGAVMTHAAQVLNNVPPANPGTSVVMGGVTIGMSYGYPTAASGTSPSTTLGIVGTLMDTSNLNTIAGPGNNSIIIYPVSIPLAASVTAATAALCGVTYMNATMTAAGASIPAVITPPSIIANVTGC
jgi:MSHA pilin protein MshA